ncbi:MAG: cation:proton antiporter [Candidatus Uhrbacteria bacterium]|nr:cation:proton antiporter [Candidatus Uhrbacteria bacterium]
MKRAQVMSHAQRAQRLGSFLLEIGLLYTLIFFILHQPGYPNIATYLAAALIPILAFYAHRLEGAFRIPFFVWAIGLGSIFREGLMPVLSSPSTLTWITTFLGILIIFGGGLDLSFAHVRRLIFPILSISIIGALVTAFLFSASLSGIATLLHLPLSIGTIGLLGAMLCSTDPASILPTFQMLKLKNPDTKTIAIAESAANDVLATIMTVVFAGFVLNNTNAPASLGALYANLLSVHVLLDFLKEIIIGGLIGYASFSLLHIWKTQGHVSRASFPFLIGIAVASFSLSTLWGGSGYLATFVAGLLFELGTEFRAVEEFFINLVDGFIKPAVFVLLGGLILPSFLGIAGLGIIMSIIFMFLVRPIAVLTSLGWFVGHQNFGIRDLLFLDAVRETGVIPAVLLLAYIPSLPDGEMAFSIGVWVILSTLIVLPLLTSWWAKKLQLVRAT